MSMLFLCTNYNFSGCVKKGTNLADVVDSKTFDRQNKKKLEALSVPELQWLDFYKLMLFRHTATNNKIIAVIHFHRYL